jgi:hypothetical protein
MECAFLAAFLPLAKPAKDDMIITYDSSKSRKKTGQISQSGVLWPESPDFIAY